MAYTMAEHPGAFLEVSVSGVENGHTLPCCGVFARIPIAFARENMSGAAFRMCFGSSKSKDKKAKADAVYLKIGEDKQSVLTANGESTMAIIYDADEKQLFAGGVRDSVEDYFFACLPKQKGWASANRTVDVGEVALGAYWSRVHTSTHEAVPVVLGARARMILKPHATSANVDLLRVIEVHDLAADEEESGEDESDEEESDEEESDEEESGEEESAAAPVAAASPSAAVEEESEEDEPIAKRLKGGGTGRALRAVPSPPPAASPSAAAVPAAKGQYMPRPSLSPRATPHERARLREPITDVIVGAGALPSYFQSPFTYLNSPCGQSAPAGCWSVSAGRCTR